MGLWSGIKSVGRAVGLGGGEQGPGAAAMNSPYADVDPNNRLNRESGRAGNLAASSAQSFQRQGQFQGRLIGDIANRIRSGQTVAGEQLRQGLQQNVAGQMAMARSASPANQAMAGRTAMRQAGQMGAGMAGQQALAAMQERIASEQALGQLMQGRRQQDMNAMLQARQQALSGYGAMEDARTSRFGSLAGAQPGTSQGERLLNTGMGIAGAAMMSDRRKKEDIRKGDDAAKRFVKSLKAYRYKYKDEGHGKGEQLGIMAQDLERTPMGKQAVINTPDGSKMVHGAKLAGALAAALAQQETRLEKLEGK